MSRHDDTISMRQMLDYAREALSMAQGRKRSDLDSDLMFQYALTHLVEVVGEAAGRVSLPTRDRHPKISWPDLVGMRNRLVHAYDAVDLNLLWDTVINDLPILITALEEILGAGKS
jgi:uncharacterized protein with HEPN domain